MQLDQAKVETLRLLYFRLGYCGSDEAVKVLTSVAIGAAGSFWVLFSEKSALSWPLKRPKSHECKCPDFIFFEKTSMVVISDILSCKHNVKLRLKLQKYAKAHGCGNT